MKKQWNVGILVFNEAEVLDFAGPFEVFSITRYPGTEDKAFCVSIIAEKKDIIFARNGFKIMPDCSFDEASQYDILLVPGGYGAEEIEINNQKLINWLLSQSEKVQIMASVCTGAFLLAKAGLLDGKKATTHWMDIDRLEAEFPDVDVQRDKKFVDEGYIITSGGISAGINMSLYLVQKLLGPDTAKETAKRMEYDF